MKFAENNLCFVSLQQIKYVEIMAKGHENLKPVQTTDEARERGRAGGIKSGEARRNKKSMREWAQIIGGFKRDVKLPDGKTMTADYAAEVVMEQFKKAQQGDTNAAAFLMRLRGEDVQKHEIVDDDMKRAALQVEMTKLYGIPTDKD